MTEVNQDRLEILYEGYFYDVTDFVKRHPGGNVIQFYTEKGEDATSVIQQFHSRSKDKVQLILRSFKTRPANYDEMNLDPKKLARHQAMTVDFSKLYAEIQKEGLFKPSYSRIIFRASECVLFLALGIYLIFYPNFFVKVLACILMGVGGGRSGWIMHEGGHNSLTGNPKVDKRLQSFFLGCFAGIPAGLWQRGHQKHHAMPQRLHHDADLNTMPFLAYNAKVVKDPKQGKSFFIQNQAWLYLTLDCFLGYWAWRLLLSPRNAWKRGEYFDLLMATLHWTVSIIVFSNAGGIWAGLFTTWVGSTYMFGQFALSHTHLPITEDHTHWVEYGLIHTSNVKSNLLVDWWMGYLNFQIEHHLFPTLPQFRCYLIQDRVKALAKKYDLPYHCYSYWEAWDKAIKNFSDVAHELKSAT